MPSTRRLVGLATLVGVAYAVAVRPLLIRWGAGALGDADRPVPQPEDAG
jgi:cell division septation protein DedD